MSNEEIQEEQLKREICELYKDYYKFAESIFKTGNNRTNLAKKLLMSNGEKELKMGSKSYSISNPKNLHEESNRKVVASFAKNILRRVNWEKFTYPHKTENILLELKKLYSILLEPAKKAGKEEELNRLRKASLDEAERLINEIDRLAQNRLEKKGSLSERVKKLEDEVQLLKEKLKL